jgi:hypothetical protein
MYNSTDMTLRQTISELNVIKNMLTQQRENWFHSWAGTVHLKGLNTNEADVKLSMNDTVKLFGKRDVNYLLNRWSPIESYAVKRQNDDELTVELKGDKGKTVQYMRDISLDHLLNTIGGCVSKIYGVVRRLRERRLDTNDGYEAPIPKKRARRNKVITNFYRINHQDGSTTWNARNEVLIGEPETVTEETPVGHTENIYDNDNWEETTNPGEAVTTEKPEETATTPDDVTTVTAETQEETRHPTEDKRKVILKRSRGSWKQ